MPVTACRALGITSVCTVNRQVSPEELLAENRELKKQLLALKGQLECASATITPTASEADTNTPLTHSSDATTVLKSLQKHWVIVVLSMQMVYLCVVNASLVVY